MRLSLSLSLFLLLLLLPPTALAGQKRSAPPPAKIVESCLAKCSEQSKRCGQSTTKGRGRGGLRRCGCAYVRCKQFCRQYGVSEFACTGSMRPQAPPVPRSEELRCKKDSDCAIRPPDPCGCRPCGTSWRRVENRKALRKLRKKHARMRCAKPRCKRCAQHFLGKHATCGMNGYCRIGL